jgi:hypothetical protein
VLTRSVCTNQECVLSRSVHYPGVCANQECVLSRSVHYPGVCADRECVLTRIVYYPSVYVSHDVYQCMLASYFVLSDETMKYLVFGALTDAVTCLVQPPVYSCLCCLCCGHFESLLEQLR